ncbi:MAG: radical SAM family heme chaperone HemW [Acidimicrobiia bacterium]|nr:radical SAM family heme chaperone HemW [Acidimicrobiia bacterium]
MAFGVYVHIPFCAHRCDYCDFATWTDRGHLVEDYVNACVADLGHRHARGEVLEADTVFFGGGTPSMVPAAQLTRILDAIPRTDGAEVTVECNPDSTSEAELALLAAAGVNRVSFGVQSMRTNVLAILGRTHDPDNVVRAVDAARNAGIRRVNLDLIYGTPGETIDDWTATVEGALRLEPEHVSAYALTVEAGTPLGRDVAAGVKPAPDDDDQADKYGIVDDLLGTQGYEWYEISNWAKPGEECRHNLVYWQGGDYLAIGCSAHGKTGPRRWWNLRTPERYIAAIRDCATPVAGDEQLDPEGRAAEARDLALRLKWGIPVGGVDPDVTTELIEMGLLTLDDDADRLVLTRAGRMLANEVVIRLQH